MHHREPCECGKERGVGPEHGVRLGHTTQRVLLPRQQRSKTSFQVVPSNRPFFKQLVLTNQKRYGQILLGLRRCVLVLSFGDGNVGTSHMH